ncbi:hypothetical protein KFU82_15190 [Escherichia coli]|nr:hypothetical protein KFU82_15190 [Escherichia coli]
MLDKLIFNSGSNPTSKSSLSVDLTPLTIFVGPNNSGKSREGANKQVISSQADSLIKISRIWADFFPANTSNQPI